jgi:gluconolactonase
LSQRNQLDFYKASTTIAADVTVVRNDAAIDSIVPAEVKAERLAEGFLFTEGPVWVPEGYLLFSDPNANTIYRWSDNDELSVFRTKSGYSGSDIGEYEQPGSNGLALDREGRLTISYSTICCTIPDTGGELAQSLAMSST